MSEFNINDVGDSMLKERLKEKATELGISEDELIDMFISKGLSDGDYSDEKYTSKQLDDDEIYLILQEDKKEDIEKGIDDDQGNFDDILNLIRLRLGI